MPPMLNDTEIDERLLEIGCAAGKRLLLEAFAAGATPAHCVALATLLLGAVFDSCVRPEFRDKATADLLLAVEEACKGDGDADQSH